MEASGEVLKQKHNRNAYEIQLSSVIRYLVLNSLVEVTSLETVLRYSD